MIDFADFAAAPNAVPAAAAAAAGKVFGSPAEATAVPFTKWYNIHERHSLDEFKAEGFILLAAVFLLAFHFVGSKINRSKAKSWMKANVDTLQSEFAQLGTDRRRVHKTYETLLQEKSLYEYSTYATGRQNVAFIDVNLTLAKRFNLIMHVLETGASFVSDMFGAPEDTVDITIYPFDGKENLTVPQLRSMPEEDRKENKSTYDGFVWALVNKSRMKKLRDDRYDVSLTVTKDSPKLPAWLTVMSESAEITESLLTQELIDAATAAGTDFDYLVVTDQPLDQPSSLDETNPRKRVYLKYHLPSDNSKLENFVPLLSHAIRLPDFLIQNAKWRPEVLKKLRQPREAKINQIKRAIEEEKAEERAADREKAKKAKRDAELQALDAKAQKKYLEKEALKEQRKAAKKMTMRG